MDQPHVTETNISKIKSVLTNHLLYLSKLNKIQLRKGKSLMNHSLHEENSSLGLVEAVHQWS